jgi:hypothetical protein
MSTLLLIAFTGLMLFAIMKWRQVRLPLFTLFFLLNIYDVWNEIQQHKWGMLALNSIGALCCVWIVYTELRNFLKKGKSNV